MAGQKLEPPVRVRLVFTDRHLLTKEQRSQGFGRSWAAISPEHSTIAEFAHDIINRFSLRCNSIHGLVFSMDGFILPSMESTSIFKDNDIIRVEHKIGKVKKTSVAIYDEEHQIEVNKIIDKQTVSLDNGTLLIENRVNASAKKKSNKIKKKKKRKRVLTEVAGNERKSRNKEVTRTSKSTSSEHQSSQETNKKTDEQLESDEEDDIDFERLLPLTCLPADGYTIAYRLVETFSGRPELSVFRVGKVIKFEPITMRILLGPVPQCPIFPDGEVPESQKSMYKEDGTLEIDFGSLVDLRLVKGKDPSKSKIITWENGTGSGSGFKHNMNSAWKTADAYNRTEERQTGWTSWQGMGQRGSRIQSQRGSRGRNGGMHRNVNSTWQAGEASNATEVTKYGWDSRAINNSRHCGPSPCWGQNANILGLYGNFSRRLNDGAGNNHSSGWEVDYRATDSQEHGWDNFAPKTRRAGASSSRMGRFSSGFGCSGGSSHSGFGCESSWSYKKQNNDMRPGNNDNSAWEVNGDPNDMRPGNNDNSAWEVNGDPNENAPAQSQENGWDAWTPNPRKAGTSWSAGQNRSGFGSGSGLFSAKRRGRGGKYSSPKFKK